MAVAVAVLALAAGLWSWRAHEPTFVATLSAPAAAGGAPMFKARLEPRRHRLLLMPLSAEAGRDGGRVRQLWLMPNGGFPHSGGLIGSGRSLPLPVSAALLKAAGPTARLGVTEEPEGGSPTGLPTGPIIAEGPLSGG